MLLIKIMEVSNGYQWFEYNKNYLESSSNPGPYDEGAGKQASSHTTRQGHWLHAPGQC
jgi:hypothetical protein